MGGGSLDRTKTVIHVDDQRPRRRDVYRHRAELIRNIQGLLALILLDILKMDRALSELVCNDVRRKACTVYVDRRAVEGIVAFDRAFYVLSAKSFRREQDRKSDMQEQSDQQHEPIIDYIFAFKTAKEGDIFLKKHKYEREREEDRRDLTPEQFYDSVGEQKQSEYQRKYRYLADGAEQRGNYAHHVKYYQGCSQKKSESPKKLSYFHFLSPFRRLCGINYILWLRHRRVVKPSASP